MRVLLRNKVILLLVLTLCLVLALSMPTLAAPSLNEIGSEPQTSAVEETQSVSQAQSTFQASSGSQGNSTTESSVTSNQESAEAVSELFKTGALTEESMEQASKLIRPVAEVINLLASIVLALLAIFLVLISVLDIVYIQIPPVRPFLYKGGSAPVMGTVGGLTPNPMMQRTMGTQDGMGSPMGMGSDTVQSGGSRPTQIVSDDAIAALAEAQAANSPAQPMMGQAPAPQPGGKNALTTYLKKRTFTLVMLGVCVVLFTCTIFTDIGVRLGMKILALLSGISL